jgi:glycosyltransferase involved in cell wall biosynthesis
MEVSVIVCCYNEEKHLPACLKSLKNQTHTDFELVVVDDGSNDGTSQIARDFGAKVIKILHSGLPTARNEGVKNASGDIIVFTDADCVVDSKWLEKLVYALKDEEYDAAIGGTVKILNPHSTLVKYLKLMEKNSIKMCLSGGYNMAYRREAIIKLGGFDPNLIRGGDYDFNLRALENGFKVNWVKDATVYFTFLEIMGELLRKQMGDGIWFREILKRHPQHLKRKISGIITGFAALLPLFRIRSLIDVYRRTRNLKIALYHALYGYAASLAFHTGFISPLIR